MKSSALILSLAIGMAACSPAPTPPAPEPAPAPPSRAVMESLQTPYTAVKGYLTQTADQASDKLYAFRPTPEVRTFGQILGHVTDANYMFCGTASGMSAPGTSVEKAATTKADLQKALAESFAFCDRAFAGLNDTTGAAEATIVPIDNMKTTKMGALSFATAHQFEHYGNLVTYMRLNKMTPPSSQN
jgi:uncharacterized damage-inducible protein DinB